MFNIFKKRKPNQNKIKPRSRKRKIFAILTLLLSLLFGKLRLRSCQSYRLNFENQTISKIVLNDQDFPENNDQQVILVKTGDRSLSVPTSPV